MYNARFDRLVGDRKKIKFTKYYDRRTKSNIGAV